MNIDTIIFDLGNVLLRWDPANLYNKLFTDKQEAEHFLATVCTMDWHTLQDAGRSPAEGTAVLLKEHPQWASQIRAFYDRWDEMFDGPIEGTVQILQEVKQKGYKVYALSNFNKELFDRTAADFPFLNLFDGKIISSEEKMKKPDDNIYHLLFERFGVAPTSAVFIDDNPDNIATGRRLGLTSILFTTPEALRTELETLHIV